MVDLDVAPCDFYLWPQLKRHLHDAIQSKEVVHDTKNASLQKWLLEVYPNYYDLASANMAIMGLRNRMQAIIHVEGRPLGLRSQKNSLLYWIFLPCVGSFCQILRPVFASEVLFYRLKTKTLKFWSKLNSKKATIPRARRRELKILEIDEHISLQGFEDAVRVNIYNFTGY